MKDDSISRKMAIDLLKKWSDGYSYIEVETNSAIKAFEEMPSAQLEYRPVTAEDFAKTMSENTVYQYMVWYGVYFTLMKEQGFEICKKTM